MSRATRSLINHGTKRTRAAAARRQITTPHKPQRLRKVTGLAPPPLGLEGPEGEKEREGDHREVVHEILGDDDAFGEAVHVLDDRRLLHHGAEGALRGVREPAEEPQREEHPEVPNPATI